MNKDTLDTKLLHSQNTILQMIATGKSLKEILVTLSLEIEKIIPDTYCSICLIKDQILEVWAGPRLPEAYNDFVTGKKIGLNVGACGTAAYLKERIISENIETDMLWENYKGVPLSYGLKSCWSQPILSSDNRVLGTFGLYYGEAKEPSEIELQILDTFTDLASVAVEYKQTYEKLENKERQYRLLAENISDFVGILDENGCYVYVSPSHEKNLGYSSEDLLGKNWMDYVHPNDLDHVRTAFAKVLVNEEEVIFRFRHKQGHWLYIEAKGAPVKEKKGDKGHIVFRASDITEKRKTEQRLEETEQKFESLFHHSLEAIFELDHNGNYISINGNAELLTGYKKEELLNMGFKDLVDPRKLDKAKADFSHAKKGKAKRFESGLIRKDGQHIHIDVNIIPLYKENKNNHVLLFVQDITDKKRAEEEVKEMAFTDSLTGLPNRASFSLKLDKAIQGMNGNSAQSLGILFIDFDNFKLINDMLGHHVGDQVLKEMVSVIKKSLSEDIVISRQGGDEFLLLVERTNKEEIRLICERLIHSFNKKPIDLNGHEVLITPSIGVCLYPDFGMDASSLIKNADLAMYAAKEIGKNNYQFYSDDLNDQVVRRNLVTNALRNSVKGNEFSLYYQPQFDLRTKKIKGLEALLRWSPDFGYVSPAEFIPIAEETGIIVEIGKWVLREACYQIKNWMDADLISTPISVNVSARQFQEPTFFEMVTAILHETQIPANMLEIEITERVMIDVKEAIEIVNALRQIGIKISLDDFGIGYSSLSMLNSIEIDTLKIDQSFLYDVMKNDKSARLLEAIIHMGEELDLKVVVEGIETDDQVNFLKNRGVIGQGYYYSRPLTVKQLENFIRSVSKT